MTVLMRHAPFDDQDTAREIRPARSIDWNKRACSEHLRQRKISPKNVSIRVVVRGLDPYY